MSDSADLRNQLETYVAGLVKPGRYHSKSEVLREGVRLVQEREARLAALDAVIAQGLADAEAGRIKPVAEVFDRLEAKYKAMAKARGSRLSSSPARPRLIWRLSVTMSPKSTFYVPLTGAI